MSIIVNMDIQEKYLKITNGKRHNQNNIWLTNERMNAQDPDNPVLVEVPALQFEKEGSQWKKQGYSKFSPTKPAPAPVEAKAVKTKEA